MSGIIVDVDGTLLSGNNGIRRTIEWVNGQAKHHKVYVITGRPESARESTTKALRNAGVKYNRLYMSSLSQHRVLESKKNHAQDLLKDGDIVLAIDDQPKARTVYSGLGIHTKNPSSLPEISKDKLRKTAWGYMRPNEKTCKHCKGQGTMSDGTGCDKCNATGMVKKAEPVSDKKEKPVWDKPAPDDDEKPGKLSPKRLARAKARAKRAGRPYPNLIDNMAVSKTYRSKEMNCDHSGMKIGEKCKPCGGTKKLGGFVKGEKQGHALRGNQHTKGRSTAGGAKPEKRAKRRGSAEMKRVADNQKKFRDSRERAKGSPMGAYLSYEKSRDDLRKELLGDS